MSDALALPGKASPTALALPKRLSHEDWLEVGRQLARVQGAIQWWIGDWLIFGEGKGYIQRERYDKAAALFQSYERRSLWQLAWVARQVQSSIRIEDLSWAHHVRIAALSPVEQRRWLTRALEGQNGRPWSQRELQQAIRNETLAARPLPDGVFRVLYADPPWAFANSGFDQSAESHYPTLSPEAIVGLPEVQEVVTTRLGVPSVLFLWVPAALLPDGLWVMRQLGFRYKTNRVWVKRASPGLGWYLRSRFEPLLIGTRTSDEGEYHPRTLVDSVVEADASVHSQKPECVYRDIEAMYDGPYLELFARCRREGWEAWGNELS